MEDVATGQTRDMAYDKLVIATGSSPKVPPIPGHDLANVTTVTCIEAAQAVQQRCAARNISNAVIVGAEIAWYETGFGPGFWQAYAFNAFTVGVGELIACVVLGQLLLSALPRVPALRPFIPERRLAQI